MYGVPSASHVPQDWSAKVGGTFHLKLNNVEVGLQPALDLRVGNLHVHMILSNDVGIVSVQANEEL